MNYYYKIDKSLLEQVDVKKRKLDAIAPSKFDFEKKFENWCRVELTYTSHALDHEKEDILPRSEFEKILRGHNYLYTSPFAHKEARNHILAWDWVRARAKQLRKISEVDERLVLSINKLLFEGIDEYQEYAGRYRTENVRIMGSGVVIPRHEKVNWYMSDFFRTLHRVGDQFHPITSDRTSRFCPYQFSQHSPLSRW